MALTLIVQNLSTTAYSEVQGGYDMRKGRVLGYQHAAVAYCA